MAFRKCQEPAVAFRKCLAEGHGCQAVWVIRSHRRLLSRSESGQRLLSRVVLEKLRWPLCLPARSRLVLCPPGDPAGQSAVTSENTHAHHRRTRRGT